jgi:hypothetical protein
MSFDISARNGGKFGTFQKDLQCDWKCCVWKSKSLNEVGIAV